MTRIEAANDAQSSTMSTVSDFSQRVSTPSREFPANCLSASHEAEGTLGVRGRRLQLCQNGPARDTRQFSQRDQHDALARAEPVVEGLVDVLQRVLRGDVPQRGAGLNENAGSCPSKTPDAAPSPCSGSAKPRPCASPRPSTSAERWGYYTAGCWWGSPRGIRGGRA